MIKQRYPRGWNEQAVREVAAHYDNQTTVERHAEIEAARKKQKITMMAVPTALVPEVQALIARRRSA